MDLNYTIQYKKGISNAAANALSWCEHDGDVSTVSECLPTWIQKLQEGYNDNPEDKQLFTELSISGSN
jgi:hypothetical protein